jgi:hypothetical protein
LNEGATGPVYYSVAELTAAINEGNRFFTLLSLGLEVTRTFTPSATFTHMLGVSGFSDWIAPLRVNDSTGAAVRSASLTDLASIDPNWIASSGTPARYCCEGADFLGVYGTSGALSVTYARAPLALVADADVPEFPAEYHGALVKYAVYRCRQAEGATEFAKALPLFSEFLDAASHFANFVRARNIGARYSRPFELETYDRSKLLNLRPDLLPAQEIAQGPGTVPTEAK